MHTGRAPRELSDIAASIAALASAAGMGVAVAESLTGGSISAELAAAPGSSDWFRGAVTAYSSQVKHTVLGVPPGPVISMSCATAMASGVAALMEADLAVAVTGVGGPDPQEDQPPGTVMLAVATSSKVVAEQRLRLRGEPGEIVHDTTRCALELLEQHLSAAPS